MTDLCVTCNHHHAQPGDTRCRRCIHLAEVAKARKALAGDEVSLKRSTVEDALELVRDLANHERILERGVSALTERVGTELKAALNEGEET